MKQHITPKELNELSEKGKKTLFEWVIEKDWWNKWEGEKYETNFGITHLPLLSIGQMIEFLNEKSGDFDLDMVLTDGGCGVAITIDNRPFGGRKELTKVDIWKNERDMFCDALWQAVKEVLEE